MRMGCCFSCNEEDENPIDSTERQQLLRDPVSNSTPVVRVPSNDCRTGGTVEIQPPRGHEDELARILQETASAMIDVSGSGSHSLDQREFQDRTKHYLNMISTLSPNLLKSPSLLLGDFPNPEKNLSSSLISSDDADLMEWAMNQIEQALHSIKVEHEEDLVVPFGQQQLVASSPSPSS